MKFPRFTLRDLFWLVLIAAMGCAWFAEHRRSVAQKARWMEDQQRLSTLEARLALLLSAEQEDARQLEALRAEVETFDHPVLKRAEALKVIAAKSSRGGLGCGLGEVRLLTSRGEVVARCGLGPIHVFGNPIDVAEPRALLEARVKSNKSGEPGPMSSSDSRHLCHISLNTLELSKDPSAIPAIIGVMQTDAVPGLRSAAARALLELGDDHWLREEIRQIKFPPEMKDLVEYLRSESTGGEKKSLDWVSFE
jgi:hypothetical protein